MEDILEFDAFMNENSSELREDFEVYLRELGYSCVEGVDDGYAEFCIQQYNNR